MYKDIEHIITLVTPYVGVWIETTCAQSYPTVILSLLMWECGLKHTFISD